MGKGDKRLSLDQWPPEGRTLGEILEPLIDPAEWSKLIEHTGELQPRYLNTMGRPVVIPVYPPSSPHHRELAEEIRLFLEIWISGKLIARGRRGDLLTGPTEIPPPSVGYDIVVEDFTRSVIGDPTDPKKAIYDLRFFRSYTEHGFKSGTESIATSQWVTQEVLQMKARGEINEDIRITDLAKELEKRMRAAGDKVKPVGFKHIKNMLPTWGLWPINSIE
jgi:hypothetical protein